MVRAFEGTGVGFLKLRMGFPCARKGIWPIGEGDLTRSAARRASKNLHLWGSETAADRKY